MYIVKFQLVNGESGNLRLRDKKQVLAHIMLYFRQPMLKSILHTFRRNGAIHFDSMGVVFHAYRVVED